VVRKGAAQHGFNECSDCNLLADLFGDIAYNLCNRV
jgi:hypothetical protein